MVLVSRGDSTGLANHLCFDQRLERVDLAVVLPLYKLDFTKSTFANDLEGGVVLRPLTRTQKA